MTGGLYPALLERAVAAPEAAGLIAIALALALAFLGPLPHAARALLRLAAPAARALALTTAGTGGLRAAILLAPAAGWFVSGGAGALLASIAAVCLMLTLCDIRWRWLPLEWTASLGASGLALALATGEALSALLSATVLMLVLTAVAVAFRRFRGTDGLGTGDILLTGAIATHLGLGATALLLFAAASAALLVEALVFRDISATRSVARTIPLGAWLAIGFVCAPTAAMVL